MRRIVSAISVAALAFSLVAMAAPANAAVAGYDSAYLAQSDWLVRSPGQTGSWTVIFQNTGTTTWTRGTSTEVEFAACLEDKVTCNAQDATEAPFNSGWLSTTRYADMNQTAVAPGQAASFTVNIAVPTGQAAGTYHFNGAVVKADTGADIRNEGAFFDVLVPGATGGAATITSLTPNSGTVNGGTSVTIAGSGFVCTPSTPTVSFGSNTGTVTSCGASQVLVTSPAGSGLGAVTVTVTNTGAAASNGLTFTYTDTTKPTYTSVTAQGNVATVTFDEAVCRTATTGTFAAADWDITVNGVANAALADSAATCDAEADNGTTTFNVFFTTTAPLGSFVAVTLTTTGGAKLRDTTGNTANAPRTNTTTATAAESTRPTITSASGSANTAVLTLNFSEPVWCGDGDGPDASDISVVTGSTTILSNGTDTCPTTQLTAALSFTVTLASNLASATTYTVTYTTVGTDEVQDVVGNDLASGASTTFTSSAADTTAPTITDARVVTNTGTTNFSDVGDSFTLTFSEAMSATVTTGDTISVQDADATPTTATFTCGTDITCVWSSSNTVLTVVLTASISGSGGTNAGLQLPLTVTATTGINDVAGNVPNLAGSADRTIDVE